MKLEHVEEIRRCFLSKAPASYYLESPNLDIKGLKHGAVSLFDGPGDQAMKVGSLGIKAIDSESMSVTLYIGYNMYEFIENHQLCIELINRFIPVIQPTISSGDHTFRKQVVYKN